MSRSSNRAADDDNNQSLRAHPKLTDTQLKKCRTKLAQPAACLGFRRVAAEDGKRVATSLTCTRLGRTTTNDVFCWHKMLPLRRHYEDHRTSSYRDAAMDSPGRHSLRCAVGKGMPSRSGALENCWETIHVQCGLELQIGPLWSTTTESKRL